MLAFAGPGPLFHAAWLEVGLDLRPALHAFQPRDLLAQLRILCLEPGIRLQNLYDQQLQLFEAKPVNGSG